MLFLIFKQLLTQYKMGIIIPFCTKVSDLIITYTIRKKNGGVELLVPSTFFKTISLFSWENKQSHCLFSSRIHSTNI